MGRVAIFEVFLVIFTKFYTVGVNKSLDFFGLIIGIREPTPLVS